MLLAAERGFSFADPFAVLVVFAGVALFAAVIALTRESEHAFTSAIVYLVLGGVAATILELLGVELLDPFRDEQVLEHLAEFAVIVALFTAGLKIDRSLTWKQWRTPTLLLLIVMPVSIALVALFASAAMGLSAGAAILLGAVLAPTDPVLAGDVQVGPPGEDDESEPHFALTAEAGLNDGLAFPFVFLGLFAAAEGGTDWLGTWVLADVLYAVPVGLAMGVLGGRLLAIVTLALRGRELIAVRFDGWLAIAAVLVVYGTTELLGAYGFLAAFTAGLAFRRWERHHEFHGRIHDGAQVVEHVSELTLVLILGSTVTLAGLAEPGLAGWLLVPVLLLVIRPLACVLTFLPTGLPLREAAFMGWFGIRGIGSVYYVAVAIGSGALTTAEEQVVYWTVFACIGVSIVVHGLTSTRFTSRLVQETGR